MEFETNALPELEFVGGNNAAGDARDITLTIFTPVYNREKTLGRVFESLRAQTRKDRFEWLIIDDGSKDGSIEVAREFLGYEGFPIRVYRQENRGKHVAWNQMLNIARGRVVMCLDSDDALVADAVETVLSDWDKLTDTECQTLKGIAYPGLNPNTLEVDGRRKPKTYPLTCSEIDYRMRYGYSGDNIGVNRLDVVRTMPFPMIKGLGGFFPENIVWFELGKKWPMKFLGKPIRLRYEDAGNQLTGSTVNRSPSNYYLWLYYVNNLSGYIAYSPKTILKGYVGLCRDGQRTGRTLREVCSAVEGAGKKLAIACLWPIGWLLK